MSAFFTAADLHPCRFLRETPAASYLLARTLRVHPNGRLSLDTVHWLFEEFRQQYNNDLDRVPFEQRPERPGIIINTASSTISYLARFAAQGRQIFRLEEDLIRMLAATDLDAVRTTDLRLPYSAFYMNFAGGLDYQIPGPPNRIDGAYIDLYEDAHGARSLQIFVTSKLLDGKLLGSAGWITGQELPLYASLDLNKDENLDSALERAVKGGDVPVVADPASVERLETATRDFEREIGGPVRWAQVTGFEIEAEHNRLAMPTLRAIVAFVGNALCLLTAAPDATHTVWPNDASRSLVEESRTGKTTKRRRRATAQLLDCGFMAVRRLQLAQDGLTGADRSDEAYHGEVATHWRRGHWRRQPHGQGLTDRKLMWIRPTLVRGDRGADTKGRIYVVDAPRSTGASGSG